MAYRFRYLDNFDNIFDKNVGSSIEFELDLANTLTKCQQLLTIRYSLPAPPVGLYCTHKMSSLLSKGGTTIGAGGGGMHRPPFLSNVRLLFVFSVQPLLNASICPLPPCTFKFLAPPLLLYT